MNVYYAKAVLYAYGHVEAVMEQLDEIVERKALSSMEDFSPCIEIAEKILGYTAQKDTLIRLKLFCDKALERFSQEELDCLDYKYFRKKPKEYYANFDYSSRTYFRRQTEIVKKFARAMERIGAGNAWFEKECLKMTFFKDMFKRVIAHEKEMQKNKSLKKNISGKSAQATVDKIKKTA